MSGLLLVPPATVRAAAFADTPRTAVALFASTERNIFTILVEACEFVCNAGTLWAQRYKATNGVVRSRQMHVTLQRQ